MGHLRLGRLPRTYRWKKVIQLLDDSSLTAPSLGDAVLKAAQNELKALETDPILSYCFWILVRITWASRSPVDKFTQELIDLGLNVTPTTSPLLLLSLISDRTREETQSLGISNFFAQLSSLSLRHALTETVLMQSPSLFGNTFENLQINLRQYSTNKNFSILTKKFFGDFFSRTLNYFVDKEVANHIGKSAAISNIRESKSFSEALTVYAKQSTRILEEYASGWYSKRNWESNGQIDRTEAEGFVSYALHKLNTVLLGEGEK